MRVNGLFGWVARNNARSSLFLLGFALLSQPMAMIVLFIPLVFLDPMHAPWFHWIGYATRYAPLVALAAVAYFAFAMWRHVNVVRDDVDFHFVDAQDEPRILDLLEPLAIALGLRLPGVGIVETAAMNAFACGVTRASSTVVFTRGLVDGLDDDELSAVIAHELIHIQQGDTRLIAAANVFMRNLIALDRANVVRPRCYRQIALMLLVPLLFPLYLGIALLTQLCVRLGYASRMLISTSREYVADAEAIRLTQNPAAMISALRRIDGNSLMSGLPSEQDAMMIAGAVPGALVTHPNVADRIEAITAMTGAIALDDRPRRDTRSPTLRKRAALRGADVARGDWAPNEARKLARIGATAAVPKQRSLGAFKRVGESGSLSVLGLRWDMGAAMLATFCTALVINHGDLAGYFSRMSHVLDLPGTHAQALMSKALSCRNASFMQLVSGGAAKPADTACEMTPDVVALAAAVGVHVLGDGRVLNASQLAMLSPQEIASANEGGFKSAPLLASQRERHNNDLAPTFPLPLHEAYVRLAGGDLRRYLRRGQCGVLVHAHVDTEPDRSVEWSIISEGEERIRFTAFLQPDGSQTTRVSLTIEDRQPTFTVLDADRTDSAGHIVKDLVGEQAVYRPALATPLRPAFAEAMTAMLEQRLFDVDRIWDLEQGGGGVTRGLCGQQGDRLRMSSEHFSIHDPMEFP